MINGPASRYTSQLYHILCYPWTSFGTAGLTLLNANKANWGQTVVLQSLIHDNFKEWLQEAQYGCTDSPLNVNLARAVSLISSSL
jgi:hypothetical protein